METLEVLSLNAKGLNTPEKRRVLLHDLQRLKTDVAFIQETHFRDDKIPILKSHLFPTVYHSTNQLAKSKGVSILISGRIPWSCIDVVRDVTGRFLFVKGKVGEVGVTLATLYAPNEHQEIFLGKVLKRLMEFSEGHLILGGDFNISLDPTVDTTLGSSSISLSRRNHIFQILHRNQLVDIWRLLHPTERDYTFYSNPHKSYSRIDYFLVPHAQLHSIQKADIGLITWSDHAPIIMLYVLGDPMMTRSKQWRLNESLLQDQSILQEVIKELGFYFATNDTLDCDPGIVWEAHKAVIRGVLIKQGARIKRKRTEQLKLLLEELAILEARHKRIQSPSLERDLGNKRTQISELLFFKAKATIQVCKRFSYESGDKCGRLLARTLREQKLKNYIPCIISPNQGRATKPKEIAQKFQEFYESLYNIKRKPSTQEQIDSYLVSSAMPHLTEEDRDDLEKPITMEELQKVVSSTKLGKAPGPDGLTAQYYKILLPSLAQYMLKLFNALGSSARLAQDTLLAHISVILKEGKDPTSCGSYRPISLLNLDLKLFTKILANRIQKYIPNLIHLDQVGFVPTREARDNTTKVINLLQIVNATQLQCVFLNTDAEKAFDRVSWSFMLSVLRHGGFGSKMLQWISSIYSCPRAQVRANGILSETFPILNGTRQGCPLSPLLFALSLEPLLCTIRSNQDVAGVHIGNLESKISAYADDILFSLTNPLITIPNLMREFEKFGGLSNLRINFDKSEAMGLNLPQTLAAQLEQNFKFKWTNKALTYLGTLIPLNTAKIYELNFPPLLQKIKTLLNKWNAGLYTWLGRCNIIKMSILPKFLYLLQALPVYIPPIYFKQSQRLIFDFIWASKHPRLQRKQLMLPKRNGGLAVPELKRYYQAIHLSRVIDWNRHRDFKMWVQIEQSQISVPLGRIPWCFPFVPREVTNHPLIGNTAKLCSKILPMVGITPTTSPLYPILGNPLFTPGYEDVAFRHLVNKGSIQAFNFIKGGVWLTIGELIEQRGDFRLKFWNAVQITHFLSTLPPPGLFDRSFNRFEKLCVEEGKMSHTLSTTYEILTILPETQSLKCVRDWERELGESFSLEQLQHIFRFTHESSICVKVQQTNFKILTRWYRTPVSLKKIYPDTSDLCWRCQVDKGTMLHIFWSCPKLRDFWREVRRILQICSDQSIPEDPAFFLLHANQITGKEYRESSIGHLLDAAKACIPLKWKSLIPPTIGMWIRKVKEISQLEDLVLTARHQQECYSRTWSSWNAFLASEEGRTLLDKN